MFLLQMAVFLIIGIIMWMVALNTYKFLTSKPKEDNSENEPFNSAFYSMLYFLIILSFVVGLLIILSAFLLFSFKSAIDLYNMFELEGEMILNEGLTAVIDIVTVLSTVVTAAFSYILKKEKTANKK